MKKLKPSLYPQHPQCVSAIGRVWYYESRGAIQIYLRPSEFDLTSNTISFKISKKMLQRSLERMR